MYYILKERRTIKRFAVSGEDVFLCRDKVKGEKENKKRGWPHSSAITLTTIVKI
jgi:hypothetical protein